MRQSMFGDYIAESATDDVGEAFLNNEVDPDDCYAVVMDDAPYGFSVEIMKNDDGANVVSADDNMFGDEASAMAWARSWVKDVQIA